MKNSSYNKIFVIDTNVFLHDPQCIFKFKDSLIVIPIVVLEEMDTFKKVKMRMLEILDNFLGTWMKYV